MYSRAMEDEYVIVNPGYGKPKFSRTELRDIAVSMVVLAVAFVILYRNSTMSWYLDYTLGGAAMWVALFAICLVLVVFSFLLHEFGHKFMAQRFGMWSEYRMYPMGLALTLITSCIGFLFAAPGAVMISGSMDDRRNGKISIAGPVVNIVLAAVGIAVTAYIGISTGGTISVNDWQTPMFLVAMLLASLNSFLALFNLLPIPPLDGSKIFRWNKAIWAVAIVIAAVELAYLYLWMPDLSITYIPRIL